MACPRNLLKSAFSLNLNDKSHSALIKFGSSESYINSKVCKDLDLKVYLSRSEIQMTFSTTKMKSKKFCLVYVKLKGSIY